MTPRTMPMLLATAAVVACATVSAHASNLGVTAAQAASWREEALALEHGEGVVKDRKRRHCFVLQGRPSRRHRGPLQPGLDVCQWTRHAAQRRFRSLLFPARGRTGRRTLPKHVGRGGATSVETALCGAGGDRRSQPPGRRTCRGGQAPQPRLWTRPPTDTNA